MVENLLSGIAAAVLVSFSIERIVEYLIGWPLEKYAPHIDREWLRYAVFLGAGASSWFSAWTIFTPDVALHPLVGRILTAVIVGCGPGIIHRIVKEPVNG